MVRGGMFSYDWGRIFVWLTGDVCLVGRGCSYDWGVIFCTVTGDVYMTRQGCLC